MRFPHPSAPLPLSRLSCAVPTLFIPRPAMFPPFPPDFSSFSSFSSPSAPFFDPSLPPDRVSPSARPQIFPFSGFFLDPFRFFPAAPRPTRLGLSAPHSGARTPFLPFLSSLSRSFSRFPCSGILFFSPLPASGISRRPFFSGALPPRFSFFPSPFLFSLSLLPPLPSLLFSSHRPFSLSVFLSLALPLLRLPLFRPPASPLPLPPHRAEQLDKKFFPCYTERNFTPLLHLRPEKGAS